MTILAAVALACHEPPDPTTTPAPDMPASLPPPTAPRDIGIRSETPEVPVIYLVSMDDRLLAFDPVARAVDEVGKIDCPGTHGSPRAASVDRQGRAWVLYRSGALYWVSTDDASCRRSNWTPGQGGWEAFGMGFVRDPDGGEALYISGASDTGRYGDLGRIDPQTGRVTSVGPLPTGETNAELAGGDAASLYAYFPGAASAYVALLDRKTGRATRTWTVPALGGQVYAWAAASLGGDVYLFASFYDAEAADGSTRTKIYRFDPDDGVTTLLRENTPYAIVGAGVGSRAPVVVR